MNQQCEHCQTPIPEGSPNGICPACLIALADVATDELPAGNFVPMTVAELSGRIPGIKLLEVIGRGGMGAVYRGYQTDLNREVAVKILPQSLSDDPVFLSRFRREAQALAKLDHPNIVTVFGSGVSDGLCYIVMEFIDGTTLREAMSAEAVDPAAALRIVPQICDALSFAHDQGVVHRDIKPENILLGVGGKVKVADFGLAKLSDEDRSHTMLTATGATLGTLRYMAPEQLDGTSVDHRADVYSLGVVFYEMLTGQVPMGRFALPSEKAGVDPRIDDVIMRTLNREPSERYQHVSDVEQELQTISQGPDQIGWNRKQSTPVGREWKSNATLFGWPIVHVAFGRNPRTGEKMVAKGVVAIGDVAVGGLAVGGASVGIISVGGVAAGVNAMGGCAAGLQAAVGGFAVASVAFGGMAIGLIAFGGSALGALAFGGAATGYVVGGGGSSGRYELEGVGIWNPPEFADSTLATALANPSMPIATFVVAFMMMIGPAALIAAFVSAGISRSRAAGVAVNKMPAGVKSKLVAGIVWPLIFVVGFPIFAAMQAAMIHRLATP